MTTEDGLAGDHILSLHEDSEGTLWIGSVGGLSRWQDDRLDAFTVADGLFDPDVFKILEDDEQNLWMSSNLGISRVAKAELEAFAAGRIDSFSSTIFDESEGLRSAECNGGNQPVGAKDRDGRLWFATIRGAAIVDPDELQINPVPPPVHIQEIRVDDRPAGKAGDAAGFVIEPGSRVVEIHFAALSYINHEEVRYRYQMQGLDETWLEVDASRQMVRYADLDAGDYVFRVKAANADGVWNEKGASAAIVVLPSWWATWWARTLYVLMAAFLVGALVVHQQRKLAREKAISRRLREVDRLKDEFLANTSHELRTPLYGITGLAEALLDRDESWSVEQIDSHLSSIIQSSRRLGRLVNDILDFSKIKHGGLSFVLQPVELHSLVDVVLTLLQPLVGEKDVQLVNAVSAELPLALADESRVQQILHNLAGNAIKFTESGRIEVSATLEGSELVVAVTDTGIGIEPDAQERIFSAFEQADASIERSFGGTGLGLAITSWLVKSHEGRLWVESEPGSGSRFSFTLPVSDQAVPSKVKTSTVEPTPGPAAVIDHGPDVPLVEPPSDGSSQSEDELFQILAVDDESVVRHVLINHLQAADYRVLYASSGGEALQCMEDHDVDLVLLDVMMPKMSGYEVCRAIRERHGLQDLPIIFLSARSQIPDLELGFAEGGNDYLTKPIAKGELLSRVGTHLELLKAHRQQAEEVKVLRGFLPICAKCKKIRDDQDGGFWSEIESYIDSHSEVSFSHGLCPDCLQDFLLVEDAYDA